MVVAVLAMLTLVPAVLSLLGDRVDWPARWGQGDRGTGGPRGLGFTGRFARLVMARPIVSVVLAGGVLIAAALPAADLKTGMAGVESLPRSEVKEAVAVLGQDFAAGMVEPV